MMFCSKKSDKRKLSIY